MSLPRGRVYKRHGKWWVHVDGWPTYGAISVGTYGYAQYKARLNVRAARENQVREQIRKTKELVEALVNPERLSSDFEAYLKGHSEYLAEQAQVPKELLEGPTSAEAFTQGRVQLGTDGSLGGPVSQKNWEKVVAGVWVLPDDPMAEKPLTWWQWWNHEMEDMSGEIGLGTGVDVLCVTCEALFGGLKDWMSGWGSALKMRYHG